MTDDRKILQLIAAPPGWYVYTDQPDDWYAEPVAAFALVEEPLTGRETNALRYGVPLTRSGDDLSAIDLASDGRSANAVLVGPGHLPPAFATEARRASWVSGDIAVITEAQLAAFV